MRSVCFFALALLAFASQARADRMIPEAEVLAASEIIRSTNCTSDCSFNGLRYEEVILPPDIVIGNRRAYSIWDPRTCGSAGCPSAIIAIGGSDVHYLADGLSISVQSPSLQSVSSATLISSTPDGGTSAAESASGSAQQPVQAANGVSSPVIFLERYPAAYAKVMEAFSGKPLYQEAINEAFDLLIQTASAQVFRDFLLDRLNLSPDVFLDSFFSDPELLATGLNKKFSAYSQNVAGGVVIDVAIGATSTYAAEEILKLKAFSDLDGQVRNILQAILSTAFEELLYTATAPNLEKAAWEGFKRRFWDLVDIAIATKGVLDTQDQIMIATVAGIESSVELQLYGSSPRSESLANAIYDDLVSRAANTYGSDDSAAIKKILKLARTALLRQKSGDTAKAILLRDRIFTVGKASNNLHMFSLLMKPTDWVAAAFNLGKDAPERVARIAIQGTSLNQLGNAVGDTSPLSGALCRTARSPLGTDDLKGILWGSKLAGINAKGASWTEYLAVGGDISNTIFVNSEGKETIGVYKITDGQVCFSYGTTNSWRCKTISRCISREADYVITDLEGKQTSLITAVEPENAGYYHFTRWAALAGQQPLTIPVDQSVPREFTAIPASYSSIAGELESLLTSGNLTALVERSQCTLSIFVRTPIMKQVLSPGGWSDWMGSTQNGQKNVGEKTDTYIVALEKVDLFRSAVDGNNRLQLAPFGGAMFTLQTQTRRTDQPSSIGGELQAIPGIQIPVANVGNTQRAMQILGDLTSMCKGDVEMTAQAISRESRPNQQGSAFSPEITSKGTQECSSIDNDIARLECFDSAFSSSVANGAEPNANSQAQSNVRPLRESIAATLLRNEAIVKKQTNFDYLPGAYEDAIAQGLVTTVWYHMGPGPRGNSWEAAVTPQGRGRGIIQSTPQSFILSNPVDIDLEVSGMTDTSAGQDQMSVKFKWAYNDISTVARRFAERGGTGSATFRLWDDGWRAENVNVRGNGLPFSLSSQVIQEIASDVATTKAQGGPWIFVQSEGIFIPVSSSQ